MFKEIDYTYLKEDLIKHSFPFDFNKIHQNFNEKVQREKNRVSSFMSEKQVKEHIRLFKDHLKVEAPRLLKPLLQETWKELRKKSPRRKLYWIKEILFTRDLTKLAYIWKWAKLTNIGGCYELQAENNFLTIWEEVYWAKRFLKKLINNGSLT